MINFAFFGSDEFSVGVLNKLASYKLIPSLIITTPDRPKGRSLILSPTPVKVWARENDIDCLQPEKLSDFAKSLEASHYSLFIVASYGKIIPKEILEIPKHGALNVHPSLLPKYRGASPIESAILNGDVETGVTIMLVDEQMDHGSIIQKSKLKIENLWYPELRDKLAEIGGKLLAEVMPKWIAGEIKATEQDHEAATYTKKVKKEDGLIELTADPELNYRKIRAFTPWPGTYFFTQKRGSTSREKIRVVIKKARLVKDEAGQARLEIDRVVPEGRKEMAWADFERNL